MIEKCKTSYEHAVFMYKVLRGGKIQTNEIMCRQMQNHNPNVFEELCDLIHCGYDFHECAEELTKLDKQPLLEAN